MRLWMIALLLVSTLLSPLYAQHQPRYAPGNKNPDGPELVGVFISSTWCVGNRAPGLHEAVEAAKLILRDRALQEQSTFRAVGVALDWHPDSGRVYLEEFGEWDEIAVGSNWFGLAPEVLIWADSTARPAIPQFIVYQHRVDTSNRPRAAFGKREYLKRVYGGETIVSWVKSGAPVP